MGFMYFAADGNYGDAENLAVVNTKGWTAADMALLDDVSDENRPEAARLISQFIESGRGENVFADRLNDLGAIIEYAPENQPETRIIEVVKRTYFKVPVPLSLDDDEACATALTAVEGGEVAINDVNDVDIEFYSNGTEIHPEY